MKKKYQKKLNLFLDVLKQSKYGNISVIFGKKEILSHIGPEKGPNAKIKIIREKCIDDFFLKGDLGWAESYIEENWETKDLTTFLEWGAKNFHEFTKFIRGKWFQKQRNN